MGKGRSRSDARVRLSFCAIVSRKGLRERLPPPAKSAMQTRFCRNVYQNYKEEQNDLGLGGAPSSLARSTPARENGPPKRQAYG
eukprot:2446207-Pleurochrysis_carterae.AAC.3